jgi:hypothetical protein
MISWHDDQLVGMGVDFNWLVALMLCYWKKWFRKIKIPGELILTSKRRRELNDLLNVDV